MPDLLRQEIATAADLIVVKIGTRVLTTDQGLLDRERIETLAEELHQLREGGRKVVLVSSGAVGAGMGRLGLRQRPTDLAHLQAVAAVGQSSLVESYDQALARHGRHAAQILLTAEDMDHRVRYLNVRNTLLTLLEYGALPIINENDTVAVDELQTTFGDNDRLAAAVTNLLRAPLLILLSDVDGLYDGDPSDPQARLIPTVTQINEAIVQLAAPRGSGVGKGGMASKLEAAHIATAAGENVIIANGHQPGTLARILAGETVGTLLVAQGQTISSRKRWIAFTAQPRGRLLLDDGAVRAVRDQKRSLLPIGIVATEGHFQKGDVVALCHPSGQEFARGLTNYSSTEIARIQGLKTSQLATTLAHSPYDEVVHRDNLALTG
ncbi:MAG: glutamate 5-kinase [Planctomycetales bacterium]|nr:glutamate 5-kinase [Planctomycetales bacterium]